MIDHTSFAVNDYKRSLDFYDQTFRILGYERLVSIDIPEVQAAGYGLAPKPSFWISNKGYEGQTEKEEVGKGRGVHMAFVAPSIESIHKWYELCIKLGGTDNGAPGPRAHYHPGYYGAFITDPNGWRIEACLHHFDPTA